MVNSSNYIPRRGDIVWITPNIQLSHEKMGRRPTLVLSPESYNIMTGRALFCPITSKVKNYPFEVLLPKKLPIAGAILSDLVKSLDLQEYKIEFICILPRETVTEVLKKLGTLLTVD